MLALLSLAPATLTLAQSPAEAGYNVLARGPTERVWGKVSWQTNSAGAAFLATNSVFAEVGNGLHYWDNGWKESQDLIEITDDGAAALHGPCKAYFSGNLNAPGAITLVHSNLVLKAEPIGLFYFDAASGKSVRLASLKGCSAELLPPNQIVWKSIFDSINADYRLSYTKGAIEADLILLERPKPPEFYHLSSSTTRLEFWTEWRSPQPRQKLIPIKPELGFTDSVLDFGGGIIFPRGRAFATDNAPPRSPATPAAVTIARPSDPGFVPVGKEWHALPDANVLVEGACWTNMAPMLDSLPEVADVGRGAGATEDRLLCLREAIDSRSWGNPANPVLLAASDYQPKGAVLDWDQVTGGVNYEFEPNSSYKVIGNAWFTGVLTFGKNAVLKFQPYGCLCATGDGSFACNGTLDQPTILTSQDDNRYGEPMGTGNPSQTAGEALWMYEPNIRDTTIQGMLICWAHTAIELDDYNANLYTIQSTAIEHCNVGLCPNFPGEYAEADIMAYSTCCDVQWPIQDGAVSVAGTFTQWCRPTVANVSANLQTSENWQEAEPAIAVNPNFNASGHHDMYIFSCRPGALTYWSATKGLMMAKSTDGGETWQSQVFASGSSGGLPACDGGDPCAVFDSNGNLFVSYLNDWTVLGEPLRAVVVELPAGQQEQWTDEGNWIRLDVNPNDPDPSFFEAPNIGGVDQPWLAVGKAPTGFPNCETLWVCYWCEDPDLSYAYVAKLSGAFIDSNGNIHRFASAQSLPASASNPMHHPRIAVGPAGQVVCTYQLDTTHLTPNHSIRYLYNNSGLGGQLDSPSFSAEDFVGDSPSLPGLVSELGTYMRGLGDRDNPWDGEPSYFPAAHARGVGNSPEIVWDWGRNRIYITYADLRTAATWPDTDVFVAYADYSDLGSPNAWHLANSGAPINSLDDNASQFMPAIAVDQGTGNVAVGWYDGRCDKANHQALKYYGAVSTNGGVTFGANFAFTLSPSDANLLDWNGASEDERSDFLDYTALAYLDSTVYAAWADNANLPVPNSSHSTSYSDIYMAHGTPPSP